MQEIKALIEVVRSVNATHQQLELSVEPLFAQAKPGQTVLARVDESWDPYLRQQWWPVRPHRQRLVVERPRAERYEIGQVIPLMGLVGKPFQFRPKLRNVLLVAWDTEPIPLLMQIPSLLAKQTSVTLVLLGKAADYDTTHLSPEVEIIKGDADLNWPNRVTTVGWADQVFVVCGQEDENAAFRRIWTLFNELRADIPPRYLWGVFHPVLPCGVGACHSCMVRTKAGYRLVCQEGPAFDLKEVILS